MDTTITITCDIDAHLKERFERECLSRESDMSKTLRLLVKQYLGVLKNEELHPIKTEE